MPAASGKGQASFASGKDGSFGARLGNANYRSDIEIFFIDRTPCAIGRTRNSR